MSTQALETVDLSAAVEWMWQSNSDPWSKTQKPNWSHYSDVENLIIEKAFLANQTHAIMDGYIIDFKHRIQISDNDKNKQRPVKRVVRQTEEKRSREARFLPDPIAPKCPFGGQYGWISPFIREVRKSLNIEKDQSPSTDENIVPMIVEKAALGIIEEGKIIGKRREAEEMAQQLMAQQNRGIKEIWKCCAHLYSLESFLYKKLNEAMRLIGSEEQEQIWLSKIRTLGPFCLLLWDNPFKNELSMNIKLYRGAQLSSEQIANYQYLSAHPNECRSFQAFTSCSRDPKVAENFLNANALFVMEVEYAFTVDLSPVSKYPEETEELITPEKDKTQSTTSRGRQPINNESREDDARYAYYRSYCRERDDYHEYEAAYDAVEDANNPALAWNLLDARGCDPDIALKNHARAAEHARRAACSVDRYGNNNLVDKSSDDDAD